MRDRERASGSACNLSENSSRPSTRSRTVFAGSIQRGNTKGRMGDQTNGKEVHIGHQPGGFVSWDTIRVYYHDYARTELALRTGEEEQEVDVEGKVSPEFTFGGSTWELIIGHDGDVETDPGYVSLHLIHVSDESIDIDVFFSVRSPNGKEIAHIDARRHTFPRFGSMLSVNNFAKRSTLMKSLYHGTLVVQVWMKLSGETAPPQDEFIPSNPIRKNILAKFGDEESSDVIFEVGGSDTFQRSTENKKAKHSTTFHAHYPVLQCNAPVLADMCKSGRVKATSVLIQDVSPRIFRQLLYYVYGGDVERDIKRDAKDIIDVANKYGVVALKLKAEVYYARSTIFTAENVIDNLLYAEAKNCALLKEAALDFLVQNAADVAGEICFDDVPSYIMNDLLAAKVRAENRNYGAFDYNLKSVGDLRMMLHDRGMDIDGSRETMIARLKK